MYTFFCSTCETKLIVKDEKLIGRIAACPKCGNMVLVKAPDDASTPQVNKKPVPQRFPDVLSQDTTSGIIGPVPVELRRSDVSDTEIKTRKILIGILIGLAAFLLLALGFLMLFRADSPPPEPSPKPIINVPDEPQPKPIVEVPDEQVPDTATTQMNTEPIQEEPTHEEPVEDVTDILTTLAEELPGLVEASLPNMDIPEKLALPIGKFNFNQQSLITFVRVMSQMTDVPMTLDIDAMKAFAISVKTPVTGQFKETTAEQILTETLATIGLQWKATDRQILIFPKATTDNVDLTFDVSDFAEKTDDLKPDVLAEMVCRLVCPEEYVVVLPENRLAVVQDESSKKSPRQLQYEIQRFLEQLRAARQQPPQTDAFGWDEVMKPMTLNHYQLVPLSRLLTQMETITELTIIVDHQSLHRALCPFASVWAAVQCNQGTVNDALESLLASIHSVGLTYRIIDHQTLEITTTESARQMEKMVVEVHRYKLRAGDTPEDIVQSLRLAVEPESWGGSGLGDIVIDAPSGCLFIRQSQPVQRQIRLCLAGNELLAP